MERNRNKVPMCTLKQEKAIREMAKGHDFILEDMVWVHTNRTQRVNEMTIEEASRLINFLKNLPI